MRILGQLLDNAAARKWESLGQYAEYVDGEKGVGHNKGARTARKKAKSAVCRWFNTPASSA